MKKYKVTLFRGANTPVASRTVEASNGKKYLLRNTKIKFGQYFSKPDGSVIK